MGYRLLANATMLVHFAFLLYVVGGGFLAWRWPRALWPHLVAASWGFATVLFSIRCPLTTVENWAREQAGLAQLSASGFIDHYLENVIYPGRYTGQVQALAAVVVLASWAGLWVLRSSPRPKARRL